MTKSCCPLNSPICCQLNRIRWVQTVSTWCPVGAPLVSNCRIQLHCKAKYLTSCWQICAFFFLDTLYPVFQSRWYKLCWITSAKQRQEKASFKSKEVNHATFAEITLISVYKVDCWGKGVRGLTHITQILYCSIFIISWSMYWPRVGCFRITGMWSRYVVRAILNVIEYLLWIFRGNRHWQIKLELPLVLVLLSWWWFIVSPGGLSSAHTPEILYQSTLLLYSQLLWFAWT